MRFGSERERETHSEWSVARTKSGSTQTKYQINGGPKN